MALTKDDIQDQVLLTLRDGPYDSSTAFENRITTLVGYALRQVNIAFDWWYILEGRTITADQVEDELQALAYAASASLVLADCGHTERAMFYESLYRRYADEFRLTYKGNPGSN